MTSATGTVTGTADEGLKIFSFERGWPSTTALALAARGDNGWCMT